MKNLNCVANPCPILLNATCVFYTGVNLLYTGILTNDNLQTALEKIDLKFKDASIGYIFQDGVVQENPGDPVTLGGILTQDVTISNGPYNFLVTNNLEAGAHVTTGGTSSDFVKGDGSLDNTPYQPSGSYITNLTGDGFANGPGVATFTLDNVNPTTGVFGSSTRVPVITTNSKGLITNITSTVINFPSSSLIFTGDVIGSGSTGSIITLTLTNVNPDVYLSDKFLKIAVNNRGLITSADEVDANDIITVLGYTPVPNSRQLTINSVTYDLTADRTWNIPILPSQNGNAGKYLQTDGSSASWESINIGSGTQNYLTKWSATPSTLDSSLIYDDGSGVMVNTTTNNSYKFDVNGSARIKTNLVVGPQNTILADTNVGIRVNTPMTLVGSTITGSSAFGVQAIGEIRSDITTSAAYFRSNANTASASFTLTNINHFQAVQSTIGAGSIVTNQYGFSADFSLTGATNNYGFYGDIASGTGRWNLYMNGTASNYINGTTYIGINTDDSSGAKLQVRGGITSTVSGSTAPVALTAINNTISAILTQIGLNTTAQVFFQNAGNPVSRIQMRMFSSGTETIRFDPFATAFSFISGSLGLGVSSSDNVNKLQVSGNIKASQYRLSTLNTAPANASAPGVEGEIRIDANHIYVCVATNTWKRTPISTWP